MKKKESQIAFFTTSIRAIYSTFVDNKVTVDCLFEYQLIRPLLNIKLKLESDF